MDLDVCDAVNGMPTLRVGETFLEDRQDPAEGARVMAESAAIGDARHVVLLGVGLGYRVQELARRGLSVVVYEPLAELVEFVRAQFPERLKGAEVFTEIPPLAAHLTTNTVPKDRTVLLVPPAYGRVFPDARTKLASTLKEVEGLTIVRENTLMERSKLIVENLMSNFARLETSPLATALGEPLQGKPAFIVSAGPSLDKNAHLIAEASKHGAVFAVNTSAPAVVAAGAMIDVLVAIEGIDASAAMTLAADKTHAVAMDLSCSPKNFEVPIKNQLAFLFASPTSIPLAQKLNTNGLVYGGSVATAAFSLAYVWGADPIVLIGQDLAYTDGRAYAQQTLFGGMTVERHGNVLVQKGCPEREETFKKYEKDGLKPQPRARPMLEAAAWGGQGTVWSTHELTMFRHFFESSAHSLKGKRRLINATEGGASIQGFEELTLRAVIDQLPLRDDELKRVIDEAKPVDPALLNRVRKELVRDAKALADAAGRCLKEQNGVSPARAKAVKEAAKRSPFAETLVTPDLLTLRNDTAITNKARERRTYTAIRDAARRVAQLGD